MKDKAFELKFCRRIKKLCRVRGLSLDALSAKSGVPIEILQPMGQNTIVENFLVEHIFDLARALGCQAYELCR